MANFLKWLDKARLFALSHKILSIIALLVLIASSFFVYQYFGGKTAVTKYVLTKVEKGIIVSSLSSSGSVSALNQIDVKAKASGNVVYVAVKGGQSVSAGQLLAKLDTKDAQKAVKTAEQNLLSTQISLEKLLGDSSLSVPRNKQDAQDNLDQAYDDGFVAVSNAFLTMPAVMTGLNSILFSYDLSKTSQNLDAYTNTSLIYDMNATIYKDSAYSTYQIAYSAYQDSFNDYKFASRYSDQDEVEKLINNAYQTAMKISDAVKSSNNMIQFYKDKVSAKGLQPNSLADTHISSLNSYTSQMNSNISSLFNAQAAIKSDKAALNDTDLDIESQKLSLQKAEDALAEAKEAINDYYVYAPFSGVVATMNAKAGDSAPSTIATIVTKTLTAEISFGETDIAKIKIGQKATLTFDAIEDLTITGKVSEIDTIGTSSQGVVSYNVKVVMDVQDDRIKPGMSATAVIITDTKTDALYVPNSALKTQQGERYVLKVSESVADSDLQNTSGVALETAPSRQTVGVGLSDDSSTEITSGLNEGDIIVSSTVSSTSTSTNASSSKNNNNFRGIPGL